MVERVAVVPAVRLPWKLEVPAGRAALLAIPSSLVDCEGVALVRIWKLVHPTPDVDRASCRELPKMVEAVGIRGRVPRVILHFAVGALGIFDLR